MKILMVCLGNICRSPLAEGILSIINAKMADAIRTITVKQGIDPNSDFIVPLKEQ